MKALEYTLCPLCGSDESREELRSRDFLYSREEFTVTSCRKCGLKYTNPRIAEAHIARYYFPGYASCTSEVAPRKTRKFIARIGKRFGDINGEALAELRSVRARSVLEIGPGSGVMLRDLKTQGFDVVGIETDSDRVRAIRENEIPCYQGSLEDVMGSLKPRSFDAAVLCHVFEHLYRPRETLDNIRSLLREGGIIYLVLPDSGSIEARLFGKYWRGLDLPRHIVHYDSRKMETLLTGSGFEIVKSGNCTFPSSFVESIGFFILRGKKMPAPLYYSLYYPWKLLSPLHLMLMGSGALRIIARRT